MGSALSFLLFCPLILLPASPAAGDALAGPAAGRDAAGAQHRDPETEEGELWRAGGGGAALSSLVGMGGGPVLGRQLQRSCNCLSSTEEFSAAAG